MNGLSPQSPREQWKARESANTQQIKKGEVPHTEGEKNMGAGGFELEKKRGKPEKKKEKADIHLVRHSARQGKISDVYVTYLVLEKRRKVSSIHQQLC